MSCIRPSSNRQNADFESLECRRHLSVSAIQDLTIDPISNGQPAWRFTVAHGVGYFVRYGASTNGSLSRTDGVTATKVIDANPFLSFNHWLPVESGLVGLKDGYPSYVWRTDGTTEGTYSIGSVNGAHYTLGNLYPIVAFHGHYYFTNDASTIFETDGNTLWNRGSAAGGWSDVAEYSDGVVFNGMQGLYKLDRAGVITRFADPSTIPGFPGGPANVEAGIIVVVRSDWTPTAQHSLWWTDGQNTVRLPVSFGNSVNYARFVGTDAKRALIEVVHQNGRRSLWSSDGTADGTTAIMPHLDGRYVRLLGNTRGQTLFVVSQSIDADIGSLCSTDGTVAGTRLLTELTPWGNYPGATNQNSLSMIGPRDTLSNDRFMYFINSDADHGAEIWRTDGTPQGTRLAFDVVPGPESGQPVLAGIVGNRLLFNATLDGHLGLFAVDLRRLPALPPIPLPPPQTQFSSTRLSSQFQEGSLDALDLLTAAPADLV